MNQQTEWNKAFTFIHNLKAVVDNKPVTADEVRGFLDSHAGRHLADQVVCGDTIEQIHAKHSIIGRGWWFVDTIRNFRQDAW